MDHYALVLCPVFALGPPLWVTHIALRNEAYVNNFNFSNLTSRLVLRDEGAYRGGCRLRAGAHGDHHLRRTTSTPIRLSLAACLGQVVHADAGYAGVDQGVRRRGLRWQIAEKRKRCSGTTYVVASIEPPVSGRTDADVR
jgi:hypothetical protein